MQVMGGNCGGIVASYVYIARDGPRYITGHSILIGFVGMAFFLTSFMTLWCRRENVRRNVLSIASGAPREVTEQRKAIEKDLADDVPWFRFTV